MTARNGRNLVFRAIRVPATTDLIKSTNLTDGRSRTEIEKQNFRMIHTHTRFCELSNFHSGTRLCNGIHLLITLHTLVRILTGTRIDDSYDSYRLGQPL